MGKHSLLFVGSLILAGTLLGPSTTSAQTTGARLPIVQLSRDDGADRACRSRLQVRLGAAAAGPASSDDTNLELGRELVRLQRIWDQRGRELMRTASELMGRPLRSEFITIRFTRCPETSRLNILVVGGGVVLNLGPPHNGAARLYEILENRDSPDDIIIGSMFLRLMRSEWFEALPGILHTPLSTRYRAQLGRSSFHLHELAMLAAVYERLGQGETADAVAAHGLFTDNATQAAYEIVKAEGSEGFVDEFGRLRFPNPPQIIRGAPQPCETAIRMLSVATLQELHDTGIGDMVRDAPRSDLRVLNGALIDEVLRLRSVANPQEWRGAQVDELLQQIC